MELEIGLSAWSKGQELAEKSLVIGQPFIGAFAIADNLGYQPETLEYKMASHAAYEVYNQAGVWTDDNGIITKIDRE
jgi:hypothetical protein